MIRVLLVDDSLTAQLHLKHILSSAPDVRVVAVAFNGEEAIEATTRFKPDLILMDIQMPKMNGIEATQRIMMTNPLPIIIVSGRADDPEMALRAVAVGALSVQEKPPGIGHPNYEAASAKFLQGIRQMAGVKVVRRWTLGNTPTTPANTALPTTSTTPPTPTSATGLTASITSTSPAASPTALPISARLRASNRDSRIYPPSELIAIGASTGGPPVLKTIFESLPSSFPAPILVVQHIAGGFLPGMVTWLSSQISLPIHIAKHGQTPLPGNIYLAPDYAHLGISTERQLIISSSPPERGLRPAVSFLFRSVSQVYGPKATGILLTGMGKDGAEELTQWHQMGAPTIAQDQESSVVHGMPGEAIRLGGASWVLTPSDIAPMLSRLTGKRISG